MKEVCLSLIIDKGDFDIKFCNVCKFFEKGNKVKVFICFKGCMIIYKEIGVKVLVEFVEVI